MRRNKAFNNFGNEFIKQKNTVEANTAPFNLSEIYFSSFTFQIVNSYR